MVLPEKLEQFLAKPNIAVIATLRRDGAPTTTACWYDIEAGRLLVTMYASSRRLANIRRRPAVAITILGEDPYQHVSLAGHVAEIWDDPELVVMDRLAMRYTGEPWPEREPCVSALIELERWHSYGLLSDSSDYSSPQAN